MEQVNKEKPKFTVDPNGPKDFAPHSTENLRYLRRVETRLVEDGSFEWMGGSLTNSRQISNVFSRLRENDREEAIILFLDYYNTPIGYDKWTGGIDFVAMDVRQIFKVMSMLNAVKVVVCHNHPSDAAKPSEPDLLFCLQLSRLCRMFGWEVWDFCVLGRSEFYSCRENNHPALGGK